MSRLLRRIWDAIDQALMWMGLIVFPIIGVLSIIAGLWLLVIDPGNVWPDEDGQQPWWFYMAIGAWMLSMGWNARKYINRWKRKDPDA